jgi:hypothetical protein
MLAVLLQLDYPADPWLEDALQWLLHRQLSDGGWNCRSLSNPRHSSMYSTYMVLWGLSKIPQRQRKTEIQKAIHRGTEFMLQHHLFKSHRTGRMIEEKWLDFHFPPVNYDVLLAARLMTDLGLAADERLTDAVQIVESKMRSDGKWLVDTVPRGYRQRKRQASTKLETEKSLSKWITLQSLIVLSRTNRMPK